MRIATYDRCVQIVAFLRGSENNMERTSYASAACAVISAGKALS